MNGPRIVIMQLTSSRQVRQWRDHCVTALGGTGLRPLGSSENLVVWQLSSGNHRPLARSTQVFATVEHAADGVEETRAQLARIKHRPLKLAARSEYVWVGNIDDEAVLMSARTYTTVRDARDSIAVAAIAFPVATLGSGSRVLSRGAL